MKFILDDEKPINPPTPAPLPPSLGQTLLQTLLVTAASAAGQLLTQGAVEFLSGKLQRKKKVQPAHMSDAPDGQQDKLNIFDVAAEMKHQGHKSEDVMSALGVAIKEESVKQLFMKWANAQTEYERMNIWTQIKEGQDASS